MKKIIHHLRQKPEETRRHILHVVVFVAGVFLILLWVYSLGRNLSGESEPVGKKSELSPFSTIKDNFIGGYENILQPDSKPQ